MKKRLIKVLNNVSSNCQEDTEIFLNENYLEYPLIFKYFKGIPEISEIIENCFLIKKSLSKKLKRYDIIELSHLVFNNGKIEDYIFETRKIDVVEELDELDNEIIKLCKNMDFMFIVNCTHYHKNIILKKMPTLYLTIINPEEQYEFTCI